MMAVVLIGYDDKLKKDVEYEFDGRVIASASSQSPEHPLLIHDVGEYAEQGFRCSACRWFDIIIYRNDDTDGWVVQTVGRSIVPGEDNRFRVHFCDTPRQVVTALAQTRDNNVYLPKVAQRALDDAADEDERLAPLVDQVLEV